VDLAEVRVGAVVDDAGARQQLLAALDFELGPELQRFGQHGDVLGLRVGKA